MSTINSEFFNEVKMKVSKNLIGKRIREVRKKLGLSQFQFAAHLGCGRSNISQIENGFFFPTASLLAALKSKFNVSLDWLFSGEGSMFTGEKEKHIDLLDFKENSNDIITMLREMKKSKFIMHRVLAEFFEIKLDLNPSILEK
jgi:transcriptional regulator with XRE-family HTH domain